LRNHNETNTVRICGLKTKEVINECSCKRLGFICDVDIDICSGCICNIIVPGPAKFCGAFGREGEYVIPYKCIKSIGEDIVIVNIDENNFLHKINTRDKMKDMFFDF